MIVFIATGELQTTLPAYDVRRDTTTVIRDDEFGGLATIPLFCVWHVHRCNIEGCTERPTTIVTQLAPDVPIAGFCEMHYREGAREGGADFTLVFDDFDAFETVDNAHLS